MATPNRNPKQPEPKVTVMSAWLSQRLETDGQRQSQVKPARASYLSLVPPDEGDEPELAA